MTPRIALISDHASPLTPPGSIDSGGQNVYVAQVALGLARRGWHVDVFTRRDDAALPAVVPWRRRVRVIHVPAGPACPLPKECLADHMPAFHRAMSRFIRREGLHYGLVHANFWMSGMVALRLKAELDLPFAITFHALGAVRRAHQGAADAFPDDRQAIEREIAREADAVIAECAQDHDDLVHFYGADEDRIHTVPCGVDLEEMVPLDHTECRRALGLPLDEPVVLQIGRLVPRKGVDNVIRGFAGWSRASGRGRFVIVGGNSDVPDDAATPEIARLRSIARAEGVADRVVFAGRRDPAALPAFYSAADVFVTTPWYEPFGITALEAMACATPVIASAVGGLKTTVVDRVTGRLVPPNDPAALARCLGELFASPARLRQLGLAGRERVASQFQWRHVVRQLEAVYREIAVPAPALRRADPVSSFSTLSAVPAL